MLFKSIIFQNLILFLESIVFSYNILNGYVDLLADPGESDVELFNAGVVLEALQNGLAARVGQAVAAQVQLLHWGSLRYQIGDQSDSFLTCDR